MTAVAPGRRGSAKKRVRAIASTTQGTEIAKPTEPEQTRDYQIAKEVPDADRPGAAQGSAK